MYILIVARGCPSEKYPLNGIFEWDQAKALVHAGFHVVYAALDLRSVRRTRTFGFSCYRKDGVQVEEYSIPLGAIPEPFFSRLGVMGFSRLYHRIIDKYGYPAVVHSHFLDISHIVSSVVSKVNTILIMTEHSSWVNQKSLSEKWRKMANHTYPKANRLVAVSSALAKNIYEHTEVSSIVIPNIVDLTMFQHNVHPPKGMMTFISVGNLVTLKRMDLLISSFHRAFAGQSDVCLKIFGTGPLFDSLSGMVVQLKMEKQIFLMGQQSREVIADNMKQSHCFVLCSDSETFGVAYAEAMAAGLPIISTDCGGPMDFLDEACGVVIPPRDEDQLVKSLMYMRKNYQNYDRDLIRQKTECFSEKAVAEKLIDLYRGEGAF